MIVVVVAVEYGGDASLCRSVKRFSSARSEWTAGRHENGGLVMHTGAECTSPAHALAK